VWYKNKQEFPKENLKGINCKADKTWTTTKKPQKTGKQARCGGAYL
jgi:hypothetical protein